MSITATIQTNGIDAAITTAAIEATFNGSINIDVDDLALAGSGGAELVGEAAGGSVQEALDRIGRTPERHGAAGDGATDDSAAILACLTAADGRPVVMNGNYYVASAVDYDGSVHITGKGTITYPYNTAALLVDSLLGSEFAVTSITTTTINSQTVNVLNVASTTGIEKGDALKIYSDDATSFDSNIWRTEMAEVVSTTATAITLDRLLYMTYTTSPRFRLLNRDARCVIDGPTFKANGDIYDTAITGRAFAAVEISGFVAPRVNVTVDRPWGAGVIAHSCYGGEIEVDVREMLDLPASNLYGYGVGIYNGSSSVSVRARGSGSRHLVTSGSSNQGVTTPFGTEAGVRKHGPAFDVVVHDIVSRGSHGYGALDTHAEAINWSFHNCAVDGAVPYPDNGYSASSTGVQNRGFNTRFFNCVIRNCRTGVLEISGTYDWSGIKSNLGTQAAGTAIGNEPSYHNCVIENAVNGVAVSGLTASRVDVLLSGVVFKNVENPVLQGTGSCRVVLQGCRDKGCKNLIAAVPSSGASMYVELLKHSRDSRGVTSPGALFAVNSGSAVAYDADLYIDGLDHQADATTALARWTSTNVSGTLAIRLGHNSSNVQLTPPTAGTVGTYTITRLEAGSIYASAAYDPPNTGAGSTSNANLTVSGAVMGDIVKASFSQALSGMILIPEVNFAGNVKVGFYNPTGAAIDLAAGTVFVEVTKRWT